MGAMVSQRVSGLAAPWSMTALAVLALLSVRPVAWAADDDAATAPIPVPAAPAASGAEAPTIAPGASPQASSESKPWTHLTIANASAQVEISTYRASIKAMRLLSEHPVNLPAWRTDGKPIDTKQPLAVLDGFRTPPEPDMQGFIEGMGLARDPSSEGEWRIVESAKGADRCVLSLTRPDLHRTYTMSYAMDATKPQVHVVLVVRNDADGAVSIAPFLRPINGIHQDDPTVEAGYQKVVIHHGKESGTLDHFDFPHDQVRAPFPSGLVLDYLGLKSRFFAAWWKPEGVRLREGGAPAALEWALGASYTGYLTQTPAGIYSQAMIDVVYKPVGGEAFVLKPGAELEIGWALGVTAMTHVELAKLDESEKRLEFTDAYYTFFKSLAKIMAWLLNLIAHVVRVYGLAVILLTFLVKALLHRFTYKQYESTMKMQKLQPELKYLQEQYKNDKQKLGMKQMELWKKHGVNPLGGCIPLLFQIPIFMGLYQMFSHLADLRGQSFLWIRDLTLPDQVWYLGFHWPFFGALATINPLPIIYIGVTVWMSMMQKPPTGGDPNQEQMFKMMRWLPVVFGVIFYNMPAGLVLYFTVQAVLSTIEIRMVKRKLGMK